MQILDCYYKYDHKEKHPTVFLVGKDANGKLRTLHTEHHYPYFYAVGELPPKLADNHMIHSIDAVDKFLPIGYQTQTTPMWKITLFNPGDTSEIRDGLIDRGLKVFEADILYKYRYMVDHNLGGMIWTNDGIHRVENELNAPLKTLAFDIEVLLNEAGNFPISSPSVDTKGNLLREADPIVIITMAMSDGNIKLLKNDDEAELLRDFVTEVNKFDPDIVVSYNGDSFDWPYIIDRAHLNEVPLSIGRDKSEPKIREVGDSSQILIRGRVSLDMLPIIRKNYSLKNYKLATAASLVNEEKLDVKPQEMRRLWLVHDAKFLQYAKQDANITLKLLLDLKLLEKYIALAKATGLLLQDVLYSGQSAMIENLFLKEFNKRDRVLGIKPRRSAAKIKSEPLDCVFGSYIETLESDDDGVKYEGATVLTPPKGLVEDVVVLDYKSLYPTIIISHNLSYDTILLDDTLDVPYEEAPKFNQEATRSPRFVDKSVLKGILPSILETLLEERLEAKKAMKAAADGSLEKTLYDAKQYSFKILLNSIYGYAGYVRSRLFVLDIAASVTSFGRENIEKTRNLIKEMGYDVVYGDTDSLFCKTNISDFDKSMEIADKLAKAATAQLPPPMELVPEAYCKRVLFLAKKHYSKYQFEKKDVGKIKSKGLETVRRDWCEYTSETLTAILNTIMLEGDVDKALQIARDAIAKIKTADLKDPDIYWKLVLSKKFGSEYKPGAETRLAHLILIDKMKKRNLMDYQVNDRVQFVVVKGASDIMKDDHRGKFREQAEDPEYALEHGIELDRKYYIEKQLVKPIHRMLGVLGVTEAMLLNTSIAKESSMQKTLFDW